jgi:hypothetical protein
MSNGLPVGSFSLALLTSSMALPAERCMSITSSMLPSSVYWEQMTWLSANVQRQIESARLWLAL